MLHFRSKREIEDLPVRLLDTGVSDGLGTATKLGNMRGLLGALDIGSCLNIARIKLDLWIHDWTNTGVSGGFPTGVTHNARFQVTQTFERSEFAFLSPVFDWPVFAHSLGDDPVKTYANEAARVADLTLTDLQIGYVFKQTAPDPATYWILLRPKTANAASLWQQLKEPLPRVRAAYASVLGGGLRHDPFAGAVFPSILIVGTAYNFAAGKFADTADSEFLTFAGTKVATFEYFPGVEYFDYDPAVLPDPANKFEQLGRTVKRHGGGPERLLIRQAASFIRYSYDSLAAGFVNSDPIWPNYDETPRRTFIGPSAGIHNDSWFIRSHSFPAFVYDFPLQEQDNTGTPYTYAPGTVNAGYESVQTEQPFNGVSNPALTTGRHIDFKSAIKLDMGVLGQEDSTIYPPSDPARYIRHLNAMK